MIIDTATTVKDLMQKVNYFYIEKDETTGTIILHFEFALKEKTE